MGGFVLVLMICGLFVCMLLWFGVLWLCDLVSCLVWLFSYFDDLFGFGIIYMFMVVVVVDIVWLLCDYGYEVCVYIG